MDENPSEVKTYSKMELIGNQNKRTVTGMVRREIYLELFFPFLEYFCLKKQN